MAIKDMNDIKSASREREAHENSIYYPTCRYCGSMELAAGEYESQEQANEAATIRCDCKLAKDYQATLKQKKEREENISKLRQRLDDFSDYCEGRGVDFSGELYDAIYNAGVAVLDRIVSNVSFKFARIKVTISTNSKEALVIAFTYSDSEKVEV